MNKKIIDSHIHLDQYEDREIAQIMATKDNHHCEKFLSVSTDLQSCMRNVQLKQQYEKVRIAFGYHPEQALNSDEEFSDLLDWIERHHEKMCAIGEVGLPYYLVNVELTPYIERLEQFFRLAVKYNKPVNLHAVYSSAPIVCDLLEKYSIQKAHFHWFKGEEQTIERIQKNRYYISITPDITYKTNIQKLATEFPIEQIFVETDGPWQFEGMFAGEMTHPRMIHATIHQLAQLKNVPKATLYDQLYSNTKRFYQF